MSNFLESQFLCIMKQLLIKTTLLVDDFGDSLKPPIAMNIQKSQICKTTFWTFFERY